MGRYVTFSLDDKGRVDLGQTNTFDATIMVAKVAGELSSEQVLVGVNSISILSILL